MPNKRKNAIWKSKKKTTQRIDYAFAEGYFLFAVPAANPPLFLINVGSSVEKRSTIFSWMKAKNEIGSRIEFKENACFSAVPRTKENLIRFLFEAV